MFILNKTFTRLRPLRQLAVIAALSACVACGGNGNPSPSPVSTTVPVTSAPTTTSTAPPTTTTAPATTTALSTITTTVPGGGPTTTTTAAPTTTIAPTTTSTSTSTSSVPTTTSVAVPTLTFAVNPSPCPLAQPPGTGVLQGSCSITASANFPASNYAFTIGNAAPSPAPNGATLASGWTVSCGVINGALNVQGTVSVSATNTSNGQIITATPRLIDFAKAAGAC